MRDAKQPLGGVTVEVRKMIDATPEAIERPRLLTYSWLVEGIQGDAERVTVRFEARGSATEVIVTHERIPNAALRDQHAYGWKGCLDGLAEYISAA